MVRKFTSAMVALIVGAAIAVFGLAQPAQAKQLSSCYAHTICFWNTSTVPAPPCCSVPVVQRDVADAPRNTCFADFTPAQPGGGTAFQTFSITNNSAYRWFYFRTSSCTGSHREIAPYTEITNIPVDWTEIHGYFRTSTTS